MVCPNIYIIIIFYCMRKRSRKNFVLFLNEIREHQFITSIIIYLLFCECDYWIHLMSVLMKINNIQFGWPLCTVLILYQKKKLFIISLSQFLISFFNTFSHQFHIPYSVQNSIFQHIHFRVYIVRSQLLVTGCWYWCISFFSPHFSFLFILLFHYIHFINCL